MQTVTHAVVQEVINNAWMSWRDAVAWCDNNLLLWRTSEPVTAEVIEVMGNYEDSDE
jgi:pyruvate-formate lyase